VGSSATSANTLYRVHNNLTANKSHTTIISFSYEEFPYNAYDKPKAKRSGGRQCSCLLSPLTHCQTYHTRHMAHQKDNLHVTNYATHSIATQASIMARICRRTCITVTSPPFKLLNSTRGFTSQPNTIY
jgi:hypothetical protein